jgi:hypothetical protein
MKNSYSFIIRFAVVCSIIATFLLSTNQAYATTARSSAALATSSVFQPQQEDKRAKILEDYLNSYNSPLAPYAQTFVDEADKNKIDWKWVAAISGVESYFGQQIPGYSYNAWGYGVYGNNVRRFSSWNDGIAVVSKALREDYINSWGATNIYQIGSLYAADRSWANKVTHFKDELDTFEINSRNKTLHISL